MTFTIKALLIFTTMVAMTCLSAIAAGIGWGFVAAVTWLPIAMARTIHQSAPMRFHRNIGLLVPSTMLCWLVVCGCYLVISWHLESLASYEILIDSLALFVGACLAGCMHGLCITIAYCIYLDWRYSLGEEIRPLNGNDLLTRRQ